MTNEEYLQQRVHVLENVVRDLMAITIRAQPYLGQTVDNLGASWDIALDALDAKRAEPLP